VLFDVNNTRILINGRQQYTYSEIFPFTCKI